MRLTCGGQACGRAALTRRYDSTATVGLYRSSDLAGSDGAEGLMLVPLKPQKDEVTYLPHRRYDKTPFLATAREKRN